MRFHKNLLVAGLMALCCAHASSPAPVGFEQRIGQRLPMNAVFFDEEGTPRTLGSLLGGKPSVLYFNYLRCPQLCSVVADGTLDVLRQLESSVGREFVVVSISIDPTDTSAMAKSWKERLVSRYGRRGAGPGWHVLTGGEDSIRQATEAAGFNFAFDPRSRQYAHPSGIILVTPEGVVSRYFLGVDFAGPELAAALRRAAQNKTGEPVFDLVLNCLEGGPPGGRFGRLIWAVLSAAVALTVAAVFGGIALMLRQEFRTRARNST